MRRSLGGGAGRWGDCFTRKVERLSLGRVRGRRHYSVFAVVLATAVAAASVSIAKSVNPDKGTDFVSAPTTYEGPLEAEGPFGAAGLAVDCVHSPIGTRSTSDVYENGATSDDPSAAVETAYSEGLFFTAPRVDLALAAQNDQRRLLTYEVDGKVLMALLLRDGPATTGTGGPGWYLEAFARCDYAEFPADVAREAGYLLWTDPQAQPIPVAEVYSAPGPEHCEWQRMTFLILDDQGQRSRSYVEAPEEELRPYVAGAYRSKVPLPPDARDTGWEREGDHLWLSTDGRYAYVGTPEAVAAWPRFQTGCE